MSEKPRLPDAVIYCREPLTAEWAKALVEKWSARFSGELIVLGEGMRLEVINGRVRSLGDGIDALWRDGP